MRVLIVNCLYYPHLRGGAERSVQILAETLVRLGIEVVVTCTRPRGRPQRDMVNGVKVIYVPIFNLHWPFDDAAHSLLARRLWHIADVVNPVMAARLRAVIREEQPTLVHTNNLQGFSVSAWQAARAENQPVVHTLRDYYLSCGRCTRFRSGRNCAVTCWECRPPAAVRRIASHCVGTVIGTSRWILDTHQRLGFFAHAAHASVIFNAATLSDVRPHGLSTGRPIRFGYLGRSDAVKGLDLLRHALAALPRAGWELLVAGPRSRREAAALRSLPMETAAISAIRFLGETTADAFFPQIDVLVVPSLWHEPLPRVILEAQAHGVPVIASRRGGCMEIVDDGRTGLLFEPAEPATLHAALNRFLDEPTLITRMGQLAHRRAVENTVEKMAQRYLDVYRAALVRSS